MAVGEKIKLLAGEALGEGAEGHLLIRTLAYLGTLGNLRSPLVLFVTTTLYIQSSTTRWSTASTDSQTTDQLQSFDNTKRLKAN